MKSMNKNLIYTYFILIIIINGCSVSIHKNIITKEGKTFSITLKDGYIYQWYSLSGESPNYIPDSQKAPLLTIQVNGQNYQPSNMIWDEEKQQVKLNYKESQVEILVNVVNKESHIVFEIAAVDHEDKVDLVIWGPFPTTINKTIGESVGVVRNDEYAIGLQALNLKTIGGYPTEDDRIPVYNDYDYNHYDKIHFHQREGQRFWGVVAKRTDFGSLLQAYCRNRSHERIIPHWDNSDIKYTAPAYNDGGVIGSKIALFGCQKEEVLKTLGKIEISEGLPHPMLEGEWVKTSPLSNAAYVITPFGVNNIDSILKNTKKAGLNCIYHPYPFDNWGHFDLNKKEFPNNWESMKACVEKAEKEGVWLGVHTLSNFVTTNDPYVTPIPDSRLAVYGSSKISDAIDDTTTIILIEDATFFVHKNTLNTIRIDDELIQYDSISTETIPLLIGCKRGAFGTQASEHKKGESVSKLADHGYGTFLTNPELTEEMANRISKLFNYTGLRMIALEGLEGAWSTGLGTYGRSLFAYSWYKGLNDVQKNKVVSAASNPEHFNWHYITRYDWGDESGGLREGETAYRIMNQPFFARNYIPLFLGGFKIEKTNSLADVEWFLARAAGFNAGFAIMLDDIEEIIQNKNGQAILDAIREWEAARIAGAFPEGLALDLQNPSKDFHLEFIGNGQWKLYPVPDAINFPTVFGEPLIISFQEPLNE